MLGENSQAIMVPSNAIIPQERTKSVIVSRQGKAQFVEVETGIRKAGSVEILSGISAATP
jgi:membrane fusion protein (multidrug efflux system)